MTTLRRAALLGIAAVLASAPAALAAEHSPRMAANDVPRVASTKTVPAPAPSRLAPPDTRPGTLDERAYLPAERAADTIAEYYASGKIRLY